MFFFILNFQSLRYVYYMSIILFSCFALTKLKYCKLKFLLDVNWFFENNLSVFFLEKIFIISIRIWINHINKKTYAMVLKKCDQIENNKFTFFLLSIFFVHKWVANHFNLFILKVSFEWIRLNKSNSTVAV